MEQNTEKFASAEFMPPPLIPTDMPTDMPTEAIEPTISTKPASERSELAAPQTDALETPAHDASDAEDKPKEELQPGTKPKPDAIGDTAFVESEKEKTGAEAEAEQDNEEKKESGDSQAEGEHFPTEEEIRQAIYSVVDPEINISIIDLGLVYDIIPNPEDRTVKINMTLTSPGCPLGPEITSAVYFNVTRMPGVRDCQVELVWEPMWDPNVNPNEETRIALGIW
ncbi:metal-sulfur cluster assembly factor [bacterium]|nr:metal-sulfur cluster assembly factor [bacterium]